MADKHFDPKRPGITDAKKKGLITLIEKNIVCECIELLSESLENQNIL